MDKVLEFALSLVNVGGKNILDIGCGNCTLISKCEEKLAWKIKGYDIVNNGCPTITIHDIRNPFPDKDFDVIFMIGVSNFVYDDFDKVLKNCYDSMSTSGSVLIFNFKSPSWRWKDILLNFRGEKTVPGYFTKKEIETKLHKLGFTYWIFHELESKNPIVSILFPRIFVEAVK